MRIESYLILLLLCGCGDSSNRRAISRNYEVEFVGGSSVLHVPSNVRLYYVAPSKKTTRIWSYVIGRTPAVIDDLIVFNGGLSDDKRWRVYPALLACQGSGPTIEISKALSRKAKEGVEYSFSLVNSTNGQFQFTGVQQPPVDLVRSLHVHLDLSREEILSAMEEARKRGEKRKYEKVDYFIEP
jgi:hypothetical protein